ncbi:HD domain-containing protein [Amycolatopsis pretoriensis]|uniref:HD domain-containing protein n=2 Tax=Amycolatopsis TaxID=1813 RepID=A0A1H5Q1B9_9PSEU|nr:HD domain-containing protein [Amycolatopsis pretoriensis]SEF19913.1 HD domain-containing protein [Amycolatopsis pretoriensis]
MTDFLALPAGPLADTILATVRKTESPAVANHSVRSFLFARLLAEHEGCVAYDAELLFAATVLHDLGLGTLAPGRTRFEVEGADLAAELLTEHGVDAPRVDLVWEAIALHTSPGIAERRGLLAYLTREGVGIDFGRKAHVVTGRHERIHEEHPRLSMVPSLVDAIVEHAARAEEAAAPRYSIAGELLRERREAGVTGLERATAGTPWA